MNTVLVLGGYGNFGKRIVEDLSDLPSTTLLIGGRRVERAVALVNRLQAKATSTLKPIAIDVYEQEFYQRLVQISPDIVIHTAGPFQGQDHSVPLACINVGAHYIDLADDRRFVCDIVNLDARARENDVLVVSGASSVPGLSSTVIEHYADEFAEIHSIDIAIAPGNKAERGEATVRGILSYTGRPFKVFSSGKWRDAYGWMDPCREDFGGEVGERWLANVDVPDLELFPDRFGVRDSVRFQAGLELPFLHFSMVVMAILAKLRLVWSWSPLAGLIFRASTFFRSMGTDKGGMKIEVEGRGHDGSHKSLRWSLSAPHGVGPYIPTISAVIIARKLIQGELVLTGATPCLGLYDLKDFAPFEKKWGMHSEAGDNG